MDQFTHKLTYHNGPLGFYLVYECIGPFYTFIKFRKKSLIVILSKTIRGSIKIDK